MKLFFRDNFKYDDVKLGDGNYGFVFDGKVRSGGPAAGCPDPEKWERVAIKTTKDISLPAERSALLSEMKAGCIFVHQPERDERVFR